MKCMEYSNQNHINIIPQSEFEDLVQEVFGVIADNITKSLGPLGSSATIFDGSIVEATKDGYHILDKYIFHNRYKKMVYNLVKTPCTKMNNTVGDGTTTSIALANEIYKLYKAHEPGIKSLYRLPRQFTSAWNHVIDMIIDEVNGMAVKIDPKDYDTIYHLAYISSNGNDDIASAIAKVYQSVDSPNIKMKDSPTNKSYIEAINGFEFPANAIDTVFVRNQDLTASEKNVFTMIFDHKIETDEFRGVIIPINEVVKAMGHKLVVIAPEYDEYMLDSECKAYIGHEYQKTHSTNVILTQYRTGALSAFQKEDLAVILRSVVVNQNLSSMIANAIQTANGDIVVERMEKSDDELFGCLGKADSVLITMKSGCIFNVSNIQDDEKYKDALEMANGELKAIMETTNYEQKAYSAKVYDAKARISQLEMKNFIYYIGADSELQKQIINDAVDDVIKCLRSAIRNGVIPGCQISIINACYNLATANLPDLESAINTIIKDACINVYGMVLNGPNKDGIDGILNAVDYDLGALGIEGNYDEDNGDVALQIIEKSVDLGKVFDLETLQYTDEVITSAETDVMVLRAASELIKILTSGNQCIFLDSDVNNSHQEDVQVYA